MVDEDPAFAGSPCRLESLHDWYLTLLSGFNRDYDDALLTSRDINLESQNLKVVPFPSQAITDCRV